MRICRKGWNPGGEPCEECEAAAGLWTHPALNQKAHEKDTYRCGCAGRVLGSERARLETLNLKVSAKESYCDFLKCFLKTLRATNRSSRKSSVLESHRLSFTQEIEITDAKAGNLLKIPTLLPSRQSRAILTFGTPDLGPTAPSVWMHADVQRENSLQNIKWQHFPVLPGVATVIASA